MAYIGEIAGCAAASRPVYPVYRCSQIQPTGLTGHWSLFATGPEGSLFHPRMICPAGQGPHLPETTLFHPRMICPAGQGPGLSETNACAWWLETGSKSSMGRYLIHMDAQDAQDFFRRRLACVPGHPQIRTRSSPESASPAAASRPDYPVHPVHRCSIYSPSRWICPVAGGGRPARRQSGVSQRGQAGFQRSRPPDTLHLTIETTPPGARASRPHAVPSVAAQFPCDVAADRPAGGNRMGPAEAEAGRRCRLIPVEEMAEAAGGFVRAGRPRSRVGFLP